MSVEKLLTCRNHSSDTFTICVPIQTDQKSSEYVSRSCKSSTEARRFGTKRIRESSTDQKTWGTSVQNLQQISPRPWYSSPRKIKKRENRWDDWIPRTTQTKHGNGEYSPTFRANQNRFTNGVDTSEVKTREGGRKRKGKTWKEVLNVKYCTNTHHWGYM